MQYKDIYTFIKIMNNLYIDNTLTAALKFAVIKIMEALRKEEKSLVELQNSLLDKHVEKDENNNYKKVETNVKGKKSIIFVYKDKEAYQTEMEQISNENFDMPKKFLMSDILNSKLSPAEIDTLIRFKMIEEDVKNGRSKK
jgi:hypothetical protein